MYEFEEVKRQVSEEYPILEEIQLSCCEDGSECHVFHREGMICVSDDFYALPLRHQLGMLWHAFGRLIMESIDGDAFLHTRDEADEVVYYNFNIRILYDDQMDMRYLDTEDVQKVL